MMKRWWVLAVLLTLALSLTSCSGPVLNNGSGWGSVTCSGSLGVFDVYLTPSKADPTLFEISIVPASVSSPGDIVTVTVANSQTLSYKTMVNQTVVNPDEEIFGGDITENDLQTFDEIAITSFDGSTNFLQANSEKDAICALPQPGDQSAN